MMLRRRLRVLLWIGRLTKQNWQWFEDLDRLRLYLHHELADICTIQLLVPSDNADLAAQAEQLKLDINVVEPSQPSDEIVGGITDASLDQESTRLNPNHLG